MTDDSNSSASDHDISIKKHLYVALAFLLFVLVLNIRKNVYIRTWFWNAFWSKGHFQKYTYKLIAGSVLATFMFGLKKKTL